MALTFTSGNKLTTATFVVPTAVTYTAWIKDPDFVTSTGPRIFENTTPTTRWFLDVTNSQFVFQRLYNNTAEWRAPFPAGIDWTQWHHLAVSHDASSTSNVATFYCDGVALTTTTTTAPTGTVNTTSNVMHIGDRPTNARPLGTGAWIGIYNAVLTQGQVKDAMDFGEYTTNRFAIWSLEVDGATFTDFSGSGLTATKSGTPTFVAQPTLSGGLESGATIRDTFDRADGALGASWTADPLALTNTGLVIVSNAAARNATSLFRSYYNVATDGPEVAVFGRIDVVPADGGDVRMLYSLQSVGTSGVDGYELKIANASSVCTWSLHSIVNQTISGALGSVTQTPAAGSWAAVIRHGNTHKVYYRAPGGSWTEILSVTDSTVTGAGYSGLASNSTAARWGMFGSGTLLTANAITADTNFAIQAMPLIVIPVGAAVNVGLSASATVTVGTPWPGGLGAGVGGLSKGKVAIRRRRRFRL
jgi:hypothetical protein